MHTAPKVKLRQASVCRYTQREREREREKAKQDLQRERGGVGRGKNAKFSVPAEEASLGGALRN